MRPAETWDNGSQTTMGHKGDMDGEVTVYEMGHELLFVLKIDSVCSCSCFGRSHGQEQTESIFRTNKSS
jgi:hypothetical protein